MSLSVQCIFLVWRVLIGQVRVHGNTGMDRNGHRHGPEWTRERTGMDTGTDRNGPEDMMKSLVLHPLFDIRIEKSLNIFT